MRPSPDFAAFHQSVLPARLGGPRGREAARDVRDAPALAFRLDDGRSHRFVPGGDAIVVEPGDDAPIVVECDAATWAAFVDEVLTAAGLHYGGGVRFVRGSYADLERWEPALRAVFQDRPIFDPRAPAPVANPGRSFPADASDAELRQVLHATGYVHVRGVLPADEIARLTAIVEREQAAARPGDGRSWWASVVNRGGGATSDDGGSVNSPG